jgi:hypothetical protein
MRLMRYVCVGWHCGDVSVGLLSYQLREVANRFKDLLLRVGYVRIPLYFVHASASKLLLILSSVGIGIFCVTAREYVSDID